MQLIACEIAGFGRLSDVSLSFEEGLNAFCRENGAGKTTLTVFIKAMFYGMEYSPRRRELTEREHYRPWQGGTYGGSLSFEAGGRRLRIERTFGKSDREDTFALIDLDTMLPSDVYSAQIGQELFSVDRESFEKSIFVPEGTLTTRMTDSFHSRMGRDGTSEREDVDRFETAVARLDEAEKGYTRTSKVNTGRLTAVRAHIRQQKEKTEQRPALEESVQAVRQQLEEVRSEQSQLAAQKQELARQIEEQSRREAFMAAFAQKEQLYAGVCSGLKQLQEFFAAGVPAAEDLDAAQEQERQLEVMQREYDEEESRMPRAEYVADLHRLFPDAEDVPSEGQIAHWEADAEQLRELHMAAEYARLPQEKRQQLADLRRYFAKKLPEEEELETVRRTLEEIARIDGNADRSAQEQDRLLRKREEIRAERRSRRHVSRLVLSLAVAAALLLGAGLLLRQNGFDLSRPERLLPAAGMVLAALVLLLAVLIVRLRRRRDYRDQMRLLDGQLAQAEKDYEAQLVLRREAEALCEAFFAPFPEEEADGPAQWLLNVRRRRETLTRLEQEEAAALEAYNGALEKLANARMALYTQLEIYAREYRIDLYAAGGMEQDLLRGLKQDAATYRDYLRRQALLAQKRQALEAQGALVDRFLSAYPAAGDTRSQRLQEIRRQTDRFVTLTQSREALAQELEGLRRDPLYSMEAVAISELQEAQRQVDERQTALAAQIHTATDHLNGLQDELDACEEAEALLQTLEEEKTQMEAAVARIRTTRSYLQAAKEAFLARYLGPLSERMRHYLSWIARGSELSEAAEDFTLDIDLQPRFVHRGQTRGAAYMSAGTQDLLALCSRFALVDVLYPGQTLPVILDDPFSSLDAEKVSEAMELLRRAAKHRQILYFTCHESRMPL